MSGLNADEAYEYQVPFTHDGINRNRATPLHVEISFARDGSALLGRVKRPYTKLPPVHYKFVPPCHVSAFAPVDFPRSRILKLACLRFNTRLISTKVGVGSSGRLVDGECRS